MFPQQNFQVWRKAESLTHGSQGRAVCRGILTSVGAAHKQDMTEHPAGGEPGSGREGRGGPVLTAQEARLVEAAAFALHLLGEVHCLLADAALLSPSPVGHPAEKAQAGAASGREAGMGQSEAAWRGHPQQCSSSRPAPAPTESTRGGLLFARAHGSGN